MDKKEYECIDCKAKRYLIFPNGNESLIICSACNRIRNIKKEFEFEPPACLCKVCINHNKTFK
mgnify:CR=1 FL=1|tara:strand:- start:4204 stop:4392 length:189 start_codon:yes stop_codon:yes gene_type:complete